MLRFLEQMEEIWNEDRCGRCDENRSSETDPALLATLICMKLRFESSGVLRASMSAACPQHVLDVQ